MQAHPLVISPVLLLVPLLPTNVTYFVIYCIQHCVYNLRQERSDIFIFMGVAIALSKMILCEVLFQQKEECSCRQCESILVLALLIIFRRQKASQLKSESLYTKILITITATQGQVQNRFLFDAILFKVHSFCNRCPEKLRRSRLEGIHSCHMFKSSLEVDHSIGSVKGFCSYLDNTRTKGGQIKN